MTIKFVDGGNTLKSSGLRMKVEVPHFD